MIRLKLQPLDAEEAFAPFGQVLSPWREGDHPRRNYAAELFNDRSGARPNLRVQRTQPTSLPFRTTQIERHAHSSQMFAPLSGGPLFRHRLSLGCRRRAAVWRSGRAFRALGDQAVNYNVGTWHLGFMAEEPGTFLMLRWEDGTSGDEEVLMLDIDITIEA